jgi:hydrogenase-4 component E
MTQILFLVMIAGNLFMLGVSRLKTCVRILALQGLALSFIPWITSGGVFSLRIMLITLVMIGLKAFWIPILIEGFIEKSNVRREVEPYLSYNFSMALGLLFLVAAFKVAGFLPLTTVAAGPKILAVAFFSMACGALLVVSRKKTVTQLMGYIVMENGIYVAQMLVEGRWPWMIEMIVLLDVVVAVMVMGRLLGHVSSELDHSDTNRMVRLKDWHGGKKGLKGHEF